MSSKDFIIEDGKVIAYVGDSKVNEITIPDGVTEIGESIFQEKMGVITLNIASSVKIIDDYAFCVKGGYKEERSASNPKKVSNVTFESWGRVHLSQVNIPKDSQLERIGNFAFYGKTDELFIPKTLLSVGKFNQSQFSNDFDIKRIEFDDECNLQEIEYLPSETFLRIPRSLKDVGTITSNFIVTIPKDFVRYNKISAPYVFVERELREDEHLKINSEFILENVDIDSIKFVNKFNECGYAYIESSKGLILTKLNNKIAKFDDIPTEIDGKPIWCNNLINPLDIDNESEKENLGDLYAKLKYEANKKKDKIFSAINKVKPNITQNNYEKFCSGVIGRSAKSSLVGVDSGATGFIFGGIAGFLIGMIMLYKIPKLNFFTPILGAIIGAVLGIMLAHKISRGINSFNALKQLQQKGEFEELYFHSTLIALNQFVKQSYEEAKRAAANAAEWSAFWDRYMHGTAEEQRQKRIENELSELNKNLRNSNSSSSYDVYTNDGEHIGRIDKK